MRYVRVSRFRVLAIAVAASAFACHRGAGPQMRFVVSTPHEDYEAQLRHVGLHTTALGRDWIAAAERALVAPIDVEIPHREVRYLDPARATAAGYRIPLHRGQRVFARINAANSPPTRFRLFLDLYLRPDTAAAPRLVASADSLVWELEYVALQPGDYLLRVQPELLRGGRVTLTVTVGASLDFPVAGRDVAAIRSRFGAPRDAGRRAHEGVDIFAPRGTPVLASIAGHVSRVTTTPLGGRVVWLRDTTFRRVLYYAHLDRQVVRSGTWVRAGDTLGFVGNTGNARTTPSHLHFGIYIRGVGAVDPFFHLYDAKREPPALADDAGLVPRWARVTAVGAVARRRPNAAAPAVAHVTPGTPVEVIAGTGEWSFARLPGGGEGYLDRLDTEPLAPTGAVALAQRAALRTAPERASDQIDWLPPGVLVSVLGQFRDYVLVRDPNGLQGWLEAATLASTAEPGTLPGGGAGAGTPIASLPAAAHDP
jgi:murein DD-endopeptidase MepM/ murein hydrolase activator NlpD